MKPEILLAMPPQTGISDDADYRNLEQDFDVNYATTSDEVDKVTAERGERIRAVVTTGGMGLTGAQMKAMPNLKFVQTRGIGVEKFDLATARERGIVIANSRSVNFFAVAEHAMALLLSLVRTIPADDAGIHAGKYRERREGPSRHLIFGKTMGILGLGDIGAAIAQRAVGFETRIIYHNRNRRSDVPYEYVGSLSELAARSDILMIAVPGGSETRRIVGSDILTALGPSGYLVNVGRGTVVDTDALLQALREKRIAGAAVDVIDGEPDLSEAILRAPNLIVTPHIAGGSPESRAAGFKHVTSNLKAHFAGEEVRHRVV